jgi:hypothetical protein
MNKQIEELAERTVNELIVELQSKTNPEISPAVVERILRLNFSGSSGQNFMEKFARLILEECVTICEEGNKTQTTSGGVAILIKQKFGLK